MDVVFRTHETLASMTEARDGKNLENLDMDGREDFVVKSL